MLYGAPTTRRRDAQRNRAAIVEAAIAVLSGPGPVTLMPEIARRAGISQATLYRHFPDRYALAAGIIGHQLHELEVAGAAGRDRPATFGRLLREVLARQIHMRPLVVLSRRLDPATRRRFQQRMIAALTPPMRLAQEHGQIRPDLEPEDLLLMLRMVAGAAEATDDLLAGQAVAERSIDLLLRGIGLVRPDP